MCGCGQKYGSFKNIHMDSCPSKCVEGPPDKYCAESTQFALVFALGGRYSDPNVVFITKPVARPN